MDIVGSNMNPKLGFKCLSRHGVWDEHYKSIVFTSLEHSKMQEGIVSGLDRSVRSKLGHSSLISGSRERRLNQPQGPGWEGENEQAEERSAYNYGYCWL